nr:MAG TPA: hypothetical protein [Crassvirales sp.]
MQTYWFVRIDMPFYGIWAIVVGIILIVLCLKAENHGNKV